MTPTDNAFLLCPVEPIEDALAGHAPGHESAWAGRLADVLEGVAQALSEHAADLAAPDGALAEADWTRPTLARQADRLRCRQVELLREANDLRRQARRAALAFRPVAQHPAGGLPEPGHNGSVPNFGDIRRRAEALVADLRRHAESETDM